MNDEVMRRYRNPVHEAPAPVSPRNPSANLLSASGDNPLCGDSLSLCIELSDDGRIVESASWSGYGCSLCIASTEALIELMAGTEVETCRSLDSADVASRLGNICVGKSRENCLKLPLSIMKEAFRSC